jgi:hypothetical protein
MTGIMAAIRLSAFPIRRSLAPVNGAFEEGSEVSFTASVAYRSLAPSATTLPASSTFCAAPGAGSRRRLNLSSVSCHQKVERRSMGNKKLW